MGDTALFQCTNGYTLSGTSSRNCLSNGLWSGEKPSCKRKHINKSFFFKESKIKKLIT